MKRMLDRREFLKDASALTVSAALAASGASAASTAAARGPRVSAVLFDGRYSSCRDFADALARQGAAAFDVRADVAAVWFGPLRDRLAECGGSVAGLTAHSDLTVSRSCARELGLALCYEGAHDSRGSIATAHRLRGRANIGAIASALRHGDSDWSESLARAIARTRCADSGERWKSSLARTSSRDDHPGFLSSWLLASPAKL